MTSLVPTQQEGLAMHALAIALQHPAVAADQHNICTLLQVSKACRAAVQQSTASMIDCSFDVQVMSPDKLSKVASFAGWLGKYAGLICTLSVKGINGRQNAESVALMAAIKQLVEFALQVAASAACGSGAPLRLQSYSSFVPATAGLLAALPAATMTYLDLNTDNSNWFAPLSRLTNLRQLRLNMKLVPASTVNSCLREIGKLQQLVQLQLDRIAVSSDVLLLPGQLQQLQLEFEGWYDRTSVGVLVCLQHLTSLQHLQLKAGRLAATSQLPPNPQSLTLQAEWPAGELVGLPSLHQVTRIELNNSSISGEDLAALHHLPQLKELSLTLEQHVDLLDVAAAFHVVPLSALDISNQVITFEELEELMPCVAATTKLSKLDIGIGEMYREGEGAGGVAVCEHLKALRQLRSLTLNIGVVEHFVQNDTQHLSALVTLTSLELASDGSGPFVDEATLCLLAVTLTELRDLSINANGEDYEQRIQSVNALPAIGRLTNLEALRLPRMSAEDAQRGLQFLTDLSRLTMFQGFNNAGEAALQEFRATIRRQQQGH